MSEIQCDWLTFRHISPSVTQTLTRWSVRRLKQREDERWEFEKERERKSINSDAARKKKKKKSPLNPPLWTLIYDGRDEDQSGGAVGVTPQPPERAPRHLFCCHSGSIKEGLRHFAIHPDKRPLHLPPRERTGTERTVGEAFYFFPSRLF